MQKVNCIVMYSYNDSYKIHNITVKHKNENITLYNDTFTLHRLYKTRFNVFNDLYKNVLDILKVNGFYVHSWNIFNSKWYNIDFIDIDTLSIDRFALK